MDINSIKLNIPKTSEGVWMPFGDDGARVRIAMWMNKNHAKYLRDLQKTYGRKIAQGTISEEKAAELMSRQWDHIITGLEGFTDGGTPVEYSPEIVAEWSLQKELFAFFQAVERISKDELNYREENIAELGEQLPITQSGLTDGPDN